MPTGYTLQGGVAWLSRVACQVQMGQSKSTGAAGRRSRRSGPRDAARAAGSSTRLVVPQPPRQLDRYRLEPLESADAPDRWRRVTAHAPE